MVLMRSNNSRPRVADFLRVFLEGLLAPAVGGGAEERDEGGGAGGDDVVLVDLAVDQLGVVLERGAEETFAGDEEDDELGRSGWNCFQ